MMFALILLSLSIIPLGHEAEYADSVELNHVVTGDNFEMVQLIFREQGVYRTRIFAWCLPKHLANSQGKMTFEANGDFHVVKYRVFHETWTDYDPEVEDRQTNPDRRGLKKFR